MTTVEKNKVIMKFMGVEPQFSDGKYHWTDSPFFYIREPSLDATVNGIAAYAKYNTSWDWLMPVIQKLFQHEFMLQVDAERCRLALPYKPTEELHEIVYQWIQKINNNNK